MKLTPDDLNTLASIAIKAAVETGHYIAKTRPTNIEHKGMGGTLASEVVTEVDRESQDRILKILGPTFSEYDLALLTEESPDDGSRLIKDYFWCIDPIDGTLCFIEGKPGYAVSIALISKEGVPVIGVVYDPVEHTLYHAVENQGAFRNSKPWTPDLRNSDDPLTVFTDRSEAEKPTFKNMVDLLHAKPRQYGGAVMNALWCLENPPACYFKFIKAGPGGGCFWDFAATACIYKEVGGDVSDINGNPLELNRTNTIDLSHCGILYVTHSGLKDTVMNTKENPK